MHLGCDTNGLPLAIVLTPGRTPEMRAFDAPVSFTAPYSGTYYLDVWAKGEFSSPSTYSLALKAG